MSLGMTRRSFLTAASAGALAVRGLADPREAPAQPKPAKLSVCQEDFEPISSWVAKRFQAKHGIEVAYTTTEFTANYEKQVADMISGSATSLYDVVQWSDPFTGVFAPKGYIEPLDAYLAKSTVVKLDQISGPWVPAATYKGKIYGAAVPQPRHAALLPEGRHPPGAADLPGDPRVGEEGEQVAPVLRLHRRLGR